jgi:D-alanine-D-alanine ligase
MSTDQNISSLNINKSAGLKKTGRKIGPKPVKVAQAIPKLKKVKLAIDREAMKKIKLVAVAYSFIEREWFPTEEAYQAELEVETRALEVVAELNKLGIPAKGYPGDLYFTTNLLVDQPDLVLNLVDTLRGRDALQTSVPAALELSNTPYTGAGLTGLVIGNNRNLVKQMMIANKIPTPPYQFIHRKGTSVEEQIGLPLIVKLNESGGSVGIDNHAVKETRENAQKQVDELIGKYKVPVMVEKFIDGLEITVVVLVDYERKHVYLGQKVFGFNPDGKHSFTSLESYGKKDSYQYQLVEDPKLARKITRYAEQAFTVLHNHDYAKFDVRVDGQSGKPYFIDANPNTAFGPSMGLPLTEVLTLYKITFSDVLASLISKYARKIEAERS